MSVRRRFRELGVAMDWSPPGRFNAITDVPGVAVGHVTLVSGSGPLVPGEGPVRTGVTVIVPHSGDVYTSRVAAAIEVFNGSGEISGRMFVDEMGMIDAPLTLTNSLNVPLVADAIISETIVRHPEVGRQPQFVHPVVAECSDVLLSDMQGRHVRREHVAAAWNGAKSGPVEEGCVGAATGLTCYGFKSGIGTASRIVKTDGGSFTVGVLVSPNHGQRHEFRVGGVPVGRIITDRLPTWHQEGSIIMVVATDAPLGPLGLRRLARRSTLGLARTGAVSHNGSGDATIAFSTGNRLNLLDDVHDLRQLAPAAMDPLFAGCVEATEEAILNAVCMAETMVGRDGNAAYALELDRLVGALGEHIATAAPR